MATFYKKKSTGYHSKPSAESSFRHIHSLLPRLFDDICRLYDNRPDLILAAWTEVIGETFAPMTEAISFYQGVLTIKVKNSTLYSLLSQHEKNRLLKNLREKFPRTEIKTIHFRLG